MIEEKIGEAIGLEKAAQKAVDEIDSLSWNAKKRNFEDYKRSWPKFIIYSVWFIVPSMTLIFFASSTDELALVKFATAAVVGVSLVLFCPLISDCAVATPIVVPIRAMDDKTKSRENFSS